MAYQGVSRTYTLERLIDYQVLRNSFSEIKVHILFSIRVISNDLWLSGYM